MILHSWGRVTYANSLYGTNMYFWRARPRPDARRVHKVRRLKSDLGISWGGESPRHCHIALNCKSCSSIYVPGIRQTDTSWSRRIDGCSHWESSTRASFWVVHLSLIQSFRWSPSLPFSLSSQRQKVVKLFSSRSKHASRCAASLGWSEELGHTVIYILQKKVKSTYIIHS